MRCSECSFLTKRFQLTLLRSCNFSHSPLKMHECSLTSSEPGRKRCILHPKYSCTHYKHFTSKTAGQIGDLTPLDRYSEEQHIGYISHIRFISCEGCHDFNVMKSLLTAANTVSFGLVCSPDPWLGVFLHATVARHVAVLEQVCFLAPYDQSPPCCRGSPWQGCPHLPRRNCSLRSQSCTWHTQTTLQDMSGEEATQIGQDEFGAVFACPPL